MTHLPVRSLRVISGGAAIVSAVLLQDSNFVVTTQTRRCTVYEKKCKSEEKPENEGQERLYWEMEMEIPALM